MPIAAITLVVVVGLAIVAGRRRHVRLRGLAWGLLAVVAAATATVAVAMVVGRLADALAPLPLRFSIRAGWLRAGLWLAVLAVVGTMARAVIGRARAIEASLVGAVVLSGLALAVAIVMPGGSIMALVPAALAGLGAAMIAWRSTAAWDLAAVLVAAGGAMVVGAELAFGLEDTFGFAAMGVVAGPLVLPAVAGVGVALAVGEHGAAVGRLAGLAAVGATIATSVGAVLPAHDADDPYPTDVVLIRDRAAQASRWYVAGGQGPPPAELRTAGFSSSPAADYPWLWMSLYPGPVAPMAPVVGLVLDDVVRDEAGDRVSIRATLKSERGSSRGSMYVAAEVVVRIAGQPVQPAVVVDWSSDPPRRWSAVAVRGLPPEGTTVELEVGSTDPIEVRLVDMALGLPPDASSEREVRAVVEARPPFAAPYQFGDVDLVVDRAEL